MMQALTMNLGILGVKEIDTELCLLLLYSKIDSNKLPTFKMTSLK